MGDKQITVKRKKYLNFTITDQRFHRFPGASYRAKGLWGFLVGLPENWQVRFKHLLAMSQEKEHSLRETIRELENLGWVIIEKVRNNLGQFERYEWTVIDNFDDVKAPEEKKRTARTKRPITSHPVGDYPQVEKPHVENPRVENQVHINTNAINTDCTEYLEDKEIENREEDPPFIPPQAGGHVAAFSPANSEQMASSQQPFIQGENNSLPANKDPGEAQNSPPPVPATPPFPSNTFGYGTALPNVVGIGPHFNAVTFCGVVTTEDIKNEGNQLTAQKEKRDIRRAEKKVWNADREAKWERFWAEYPNHEDEPQARAAFIKLDPSDEDFETLMMDIAWRKLHDRSWRDPQFVWRAKNYLPKHGGKYRWKENTGKWNFNDPAKQESLQETHEREMQDPNSGRYKFVHEEDDLIKWLESNKE